MPKTVKYYLSKGFDAKMAAYFAAGRRTIVSVTPNDNYTLTIRFDNGEDRLYDISPFIQPDTVFAFLKDMQHFRRVYVDEQHSIAWDKDPAVDSNVVWSNKVDLCPDSCYVDSVPLGTTKF